MARVFITGAAGFIGRALGERLRAQGHEVSGCDFKADPAAQVVAGNVGEPGRWQAAMAGSDVVIHTAATVSLRTERPEEVWKANVLGTRHVIDACERGEVGRLVHFSSVTVFGFDFPDGVDEHYPVRWTNVPYPDSKIASEQVVLQAQAEGRISATIVRPGDVYGPGSRAWAILPAQLIRERRFTLPDGGRGIFSPVYIENLIEGVIAAGERPAAAGQVLTLSDGIGVPNRDFFAPYAELVGRRLMTLPTPLALGAAAAVQRVARLGSGDNDINPGSVRYMLRRGTYSNAKARQLLGWEPRVGVTEGLERTVEWLRAEGYGAG